MENLRKLSVLIWKNWLFRKRQYIMTSFEIILPTIFSIILVTIRTKGDFEVQYRPAKSYSSSNIDQKIYCLENCTFLYTPNNSRALDLLEHVTKIVWKSVEFIPFENETAMEEWAIKKTKPGFPSDYAAGISFLNFPSTGDTLPEKLHYRLRFASQSDWNTKTLAPPIAVPGPVRSYWAYKGGFLSLQHVIAMRFIELQSNENDLLDKTLISEQQFAYPPYYEDRGFSNMLNILLPMFIVLSYVFISPTLIKYIVREKEVGIKELMKLMGLPSWIQWCGWFMNSFIMMTISAIIITVLLCVKFQGVAVLTYSAPELIFFLLVLYIISSICFCFFIASLFSKPTLATAVGVIVWLVSYFAPYSTLNAIYENISLTQKLSVSIFPNMAMAWCTRFIISFEGQRLGLQWSLLGTPSYPGDDLTVNHLILMFIVDIILYSFLTWYIDNVFPGVYGIGKSWYFFLMKSFWIDSKPTFIDPESIDEGKVSDKFQNEPVGLTPSVIIKQLTKSYGWGSYSKLAVNKLNLRIFEGQITALLGHNGAGKTTTMSMLTGMYQPTNGTAFINGYDIRTDIDKARKDLGLCPQENMLFNTLTVWEHLLFFGKLKKMSSETLNQELPILLQKLQLWDKKDTFAMSLSGGMKRKLNLGIALIGKPKVIMLDEPTSGMDPEARRAIWDLLQEIRPGRCIVLTTHFMEEADVLGDRIAIMVEGQVECCGSPLFLKKRYGAGYHLNICTDQYCRVENVINFIQNHLPGAYVKSNDGSDLVVILPTEESERFPEMFDDLENNLQKLRIDHFGVSVTSMEEVFLKVGEENEKDNETGAAALKTSTSTELIEEGTGAAAQVAKKNAQLSLWLEQIQGLFLKRWYYSSRRWVLLISQILIPMVMVINALAVNNLLSKIFYPDPPLVMDISQYGNTKVFYKSKSEEISKWYTDSFPDGTTFENWTDKNITRSLIELGEADYRSYAKEHIVGSDFSLSDDKYFEANLWFNGLYYHSEPLGLNLIHNALVNKYVKRSNVSIVVENYPFPANKDDNWNAPMEVMLKAFVMGMFIPIGFSFLSSSFVVYPIHERATKSKHLQMMTGVNGFLFWGISFIWDFATHILASIIVLIIFVTADDTETFTGGKRSGVAMLMMLLYGWASVPFTYLISFISNIPATGFTRLTVINIIASIILSNITFTFQMSPNLKTIADILKWFFFFLPNYTVTIGFMNMVQITDVRLKSVDYFDWDAPGIGQTITVFVITGLLYFILLGLIEHGIFYKVWYSVCGCCKEKKRVIVVDTEMSIDGRLDEDVVNEQERVRMLTARGDFGDDILIVNDLSKQFWNFQAVNHLSFGVKNSECFGLLGVNGAGKTTTFSMLTGVLVVSSGNANIQRISLIRDRQGFLQKIGYCPQFDALIDYLTGREMLTVFAHLRGIPKNLIKFTVDTFIKKFDLSAHADKITLAYSGGTKRKLSAALAFIGDPPLIFLDEPTTGVDPVARRKIWDILKSANSSGMSVVLTSHSMEECEVLCSRIAIMVNGQFQCLGGIQYLKNKFSQGFNVLAKLKHIENDDGRNQTNFQTFMQHKFPSGGVKDVHQGLVQYHITDINTRWAYLFATMEEAKRQFNLEDYSISQATLEQVFLSFARHQVKTIIQ